MPAAVKVRVPATVANLGPGFDTLGVALRMHLEVEIEPGAAGSRSLFRAKVRRRSRRTTRTSSCGR